MTKVLATPLMESAKAPAVCGLLVDAFLKADKGRIYGCASI